MFDVAASKKLLKASMDEFDNALGYLINGNPPNIIPPANDKISTQLVAEVL
jgi:hypothetical protein